MIIENDLGGNMTFPTFWYILLFMVSICGVISWYLRNYTERVDLLRFFAIMGVISMLTLLGWTLTMDV
ncbi:MAG: hypothetical protein CMA27_06250 [Euryarchaeota archaeon]|nr:hypothetical protein [Euryarchaeota archaeon]